MQFSKLKLQQLRYFMDVVSTKSFTRAAERNFTSQSNISYAVRELEKIVGVPLFIRKANEVTMTKFGEEFYPWVEKGLIELEMGCQRIRDMSDPISGEVRIGFSFIFSLSMVPELFRFIYASAQQEGAQIDMHPMMAHVDDNLRSVEEMMLDGSCDLGLTCVRVREEIASVPIGWQELVLLLPKSHPLAHCKKLTLTDVKDEPFSLLSGDTELTGNHYIKMFEHDGITPHLVNSGMDWLSLLVGISSGQYLSIAPKSNLKGYDIVSIPLEHTMKMRSVHLAWPLNRKLTSSAKYVKQLILNKYNNEEEKGE